MSRELKIDDQIALGLVNVGDLQVVLEQYGDARKNLEQGLEISRTVGNSYVEIAALLTLARLESEENR